MEAAVILNPGEGLVFLLLNDFRSVKLEDAKRREQLIYHDGASILVFLRGASII